jgi:hypothetical protein
VSASSRIQLAAAAAVLLALVAPPAAADDRIAVASLGGGAVEVLWVPEDGNWPQGGWRLERIGPAGAVIVARQAGPGLDVGAMARLPREQSSGIADFASKLRTGTLTADEQQAADMVLIVAAILHGEYGRALGVRFGEIGVPPGATFYRLTALDRNGASIRSVESGEIDTREATELPAAPETVSATVTSEGVLLTWTEPPQSEAAPVIGYRVTRTGSGGPRDLTPDLVLRATSGLGADRPTRLSFLDREAVRTAASGYELTGVDAFGRTSPPKRVEISLGTLARAAVPADVGATPGIGSAAISWTPVRQAGVAGYVVERALFLDGPYEALTPDGLAPGTARFEATDLSPGTAYYFRVRVYDSDGALGTPSLPVKAIANAAGPPPAPTNLTADGGPTRVALSWEESQPVAGYFVYRRLAGEAQWTRLNGELITEPGYFDRFERGAFSQQRLAYRVQAVGFDSQGGAFSTEAAVAFDDLRPPGTPVITGGSGEGGTARIDFVPGAPENDSAGFVILRADDERRPGKVITDPLPQSTRTFADADVTPGEGYWYEVVALDAAGNRSDPSERVRIEVGAPALPTPPTPTATFRAMPFPYVELKLAPPPARAQAFVEAQTNGGKWLSVAGPVADVTTINLTDLPALGSEVTYRVIYQAANGVRGAPSPSVAVTLR